MLAHQISNMLKFQDQRVFAYFMSSFEPHLSRFSAYFASFASFSSYSSDLKIIQLIASKDLRETETELKEKKALYNYCVFEWLSVRTWGNQKSDFCQPNLADLEHFVSYSGLLNPPSHSNFPLRRLWIINDVLAFGAMLISRKFLELYCTSGQ